jgi:hypothetical protein
VRARPEAAYDYEELGRMAGQQAAPAPEPEREPQP